ncbi:MAG: S49 family peptidase [Lactobacillales bacterium]|jgi:ClpP class serine protease|nr:S49 family peptidase [Lactobacillales bacterium]
MKLLKQTPWAITPEMLTMMMEIANRDKTTPEAIAKQIGKQMNETYAVTIRDGVAIIPIHGPLFRYANLFSMICGATSYEMLARDFTKAMSNPNVHSILFDIDSPGGEVNGCSELADMIFQARGQKNIVAYASGSCCSGAYWIGSSCDKIIISDTAMLGSIGVVALYRKEEDEDEIEIVSSQSPNKRPSVSTDEGRSRIQARIDETAEVFINKVARNRNISPKQVVENFGGGDCYVGASAVKVGLADGISTFEDILSGLNIQPMESTQMNEKQETPTPDIKAQERARMTDVLSSEHAKGREKTAQMLLSVTDLAANQIVAILETVPVVKEGTFEKVMAQTPNPKITPATGADEETPDTMAMRIVNHLKEG